MKHKQSNVLEQIVKLFKDSNIARAHFSIYHLYATENNAVDFSVAVLDSEQIIIITANDSDYTTGELPKFFALKSPF